MHEQSRVLEVGFDGATFRTVRADARVLPSAKSPVATARAGGVATASAQCGVGQPGAVVGNTPSSPRSLTGNDSGIFTWDYLYELGQKQDAQLWAQYTERLAAAGADRDAPMAPKGGEMLAAATEAVRRRAGREAPSAAQAPVHQAALKI